MRVKELREKLSVFEDDDVVIMSKDDKGSGFSPLSMLVYADYVAESTWAGQIYGPGEIKRLNLPIEDEAESACVLWPRN